MKLKVLWCNSQMFAEVVVHTITIRLQNFIRVCGLPFSNAVKMSYNFNYICGLKLLTCISQGTLQYALFHIGNKISLFLVS